MPAAPTPAATSSGRSVPELAGAGGEERPAALVEIAAPPARRRADQLEQFRVFERSIGSHAQLDASELGGTQVEGDDPRRLPGEECQGVIAGRRDRQANVAGADVERLQEDIGVLPALRVAYAAEIGLGGNLTAHRKLRWLAGVSSCELFCGILLRQFRLQRAFALGPGLLTPPLGGEALSAGLLTPRARRGSPDPSRSARVS